MLEYGFTCLGLHSVQLTVFSYNERAVRAYTRAGFRAVGRWREAKRLAGRAFDVICMDCLATEFGPSGASTLRTLLPRAQALPRRAIVPMEALAGKRPLPVAL